MQIVGSSANIMSGLLVVCAVGTHMCANRELI